LKSPFLKVRSGVSWFAVFVIAPMILRAQVVLARLWARLFLGGPAPSPFDLSLVKRVLVVRLDAIGDVVMTTPLLRELRRSLPDAHITLVVNPILYDLMRNCPYVNEIVWFDCLPPYRWNPLPLFWRAFRTARRHWWQTPIDLAILPRREFDAWAGAFLVFFSGARWRIAYSEHISARKHALNPTFDTLFTRVVGDALGSFHEVEHNLNILRAIGGRVEEDQTELWVSSASAARVDELLREHRIENGDLILGFCPGASSRLKQWPLEKFSELAAAFVDRYACKIVVVGGPEDAILGADIVASSTRGITNLAGILSLEETAALIKRCELFITNDTGPMHIAAAVGTKVLAIFGSSCEHRFGPWKVHEVIATDLACRPCNRGHALDRCERCIYDEPRCLLEVTVQSVFRRADSMLGPAVSVSSLAEHR